METSGLLPTPEALNSEGYQTSGGKKWPRLGKVIQELLPTPRAGNPGSRPNKKGGKILAEVVATSSQVDSPANLFPKPDEEKERQTTVTSGRKCYELYESFIRAGSSVKMLAASLLGTKAWFSNKCMLIWKVKVTKSKRLLFQLSPSMRRTGEIGSGLLHTPSTQESGVSAERLQTKEGEPAKIGERAYDKHTGRLAQVGLPQQIEMLPTPNAGARGARSAEGMTKGHEVNLSDALKHRTGTKTGLKLQPAFVEWMMGFPEGWTEIPDSKLLEMRLSRKSQKK